MEKTTYQDHNGNIHEADILKNCPFCGGAAEFKFIGNSCSKAIYGKIECGNCYIYVKHGTRSGNSEKALQYAIEIWNFREGVKQTLIEFLDDIREYEHQIMDSIYNDDRESIEFVDIFLKKHYNNNDN